ncbi:MAG TPA: glycosyltransferase family 4 protein [Blastocatellia bacterium]|nr:glycosyltransferase family 4 protein [Blastocatellia bacterium]
MKILQVCSASEMGGGEVHVADLVRALAERGHAVYLAVRPNSPLREPLAGVIASWHEMPLRNSLDVQSARAIAELIKQHGIEIVHAHVGRDYLVAALAVRHVPWVKLVLTRHHYLPLKRNAVHRWMLGGVSAVIAVSESVRQSVIERLELPPERVHTIPNWVDPVRFQLIERDAARALFRLRGSLVVACVGQITPAKGQEEFIRAAGRIVNMRSDTEFVLAGEESESNGDFTSQLTRLAETLGLKDRVRFMGHVRHMAEFFAAVDVVVVPSWDEGFSLVTIEAMAAKRPVIASNVGGIAQIITDNATGLLFPARDVRALTEKLIWMLSDAPLRDRLAVQAQKDVYARFGREKTIDRIEALYMKLLAKEVE